MKKILASIIALGFCFSIAATEYAPWFGDLYVFEVRPTYIYQHYDRVQSPDDSFSYPGNAHFVNLSLSISPEIDWNVEAELVFAKTHDTDFNYEKIKATGRYQIFDDLLGDPYNLTVGLSLIEVNPHFLDDFEIYEHGELNAELHLALGKEISECFIDTWAYKYWGILGIGQANEGAPWLFSHIEWDINFCDYFELGAYSKLLFGLGERNINPDNRFNGYAHIQHHSIDLGLFYRLNIRYFGAFTVDYSFRPYTKNFPELAHTVKATLLFTYSL